MTTTSGTRVERPRTATDAADLLRSGTGPVLFRGGGTKLDWAGRVRTPELVVDTTSLTGVLTHNPADMTASVRAGTTLTALQDHLAAHDQWLALDPPTALRGATVGGLLAAGDSGPSRLRYGALRDLVIGVTLVLGDGTVARSGGHVIKNVAGYDLAKLAYGSLGTLALIAEVVVRLHPRPAATSTIAGTADADQATAAALRIAASPLEPAAVEWVGDGGAATSGRLLVRVDGTPAPIQATTLALVELLADGGVAAAPVDPEEAPALWRAHADAVLGEPEETVLRVSTLPTELAALARHVCTAAAAAGVGARVVSGVAVGLHTVRLAGGAPEAHAQVLTALRRHVGERGGSVLLGRRPDALDDLVDLVDVLGPPPSTVALLRRVKAQFDPPGRCAPGRMRPWY